MEVKQRTSCIIINRFYTVDGKYYFGPNDWPESEKSNENPSSCPPSCTDVTVIPLLRSTVLPSFSYNTRKKQFNLNNLYPLTKANCIIYTDFAWLEILKKKIFYVRYRFASGVDLFL